MENAEKWVHWFGVDFSIQVSIPFTNYVFKKVYFKLKIYEIYNF